MTASPAFLHDRAEASKLEAPEGERDSTESTLIGQSIRADCPVDAAVCIVILHTTQPYADMNVRFASLTLLCLLLTPLILPAQEGGRLENPTKLYMGMVTAPDGTPVTSGKVLVFEDPYPNVVTSSKISGEIGYRFQLDPEKIYVFRVEAPGYFSQEYIFSTPSGFDYAEVTENLTVEPIRKDSVLFSGTPFEPETATIRAGALDEVVHFLSENPSVLVTIAVGLTEDRVDPLTRGRVEAIKALFEATELSLTRITWFRDLASPFDSYRVTITGFEAAVD